MRTSKPEARRKKRAQRKIKGAELYAVSGGGWRICHSKEERGLYETRHRSTEAKQRIPRAIALRLEPWQLNKPLLGLGNTLNYYGPLKASITRDCCPLCSTPNKGKFRLTADGVRRLYARRATK